MSIGSTNEPSAEAAPLTLAAFTERAMQLRQHFAAWEQAQYGRAWTVEEIALGFVGDVGDLAKLILAQQGVRQIPDAEQKLAHELADCLWSVLVLARLCKIDLARAFVTTMDELERAIQQKLAD